MARRVTIPNPSAPGGLIPARLITDRAKRYRAQSAIEQEDKRCIYCGNPRGTLDVEHINGNEDDGEPRNLAYACRSCNTAKGAHFRNVGAGRRTRQYNPSKKKGARTMGQWVKAVMIMKGKATDDKMSLDQAIELIQDTPPSRRSQFAAEIYARRRERQLDIPF